MVDIQSHFSHSSHSLCRRSTLGNPHLAFMKREIIALSDGTFAVSITYPVTCLPRIPHSSPTRRFATGTLADSVPLRQERS